jgi:hypothetical protein
MRETKVLLASRSPFEFRMQKKDGATPEEKDLFRAWTLGGWDAPLAYEDHRASPARSKRLDYV